MGEGGRLGPCKTGFGEEGRLGLGETYFGEGGRLDEERLVLGEERLGLGEERLGLGEWRLGLHKGDLGKGGRPLWRQPGLEPALAESCGKKKHNPYLHSVILGINPQNHLFLQVSNTRG